MVKKITGALLAVLFVASMGTIMPRVNAVAMNSSPVNVYDDLVILGEPAIASGSLILTGSSSITNTTGNLLLNDEFIELTGTIFNGLRDVPFAEQIDPITIDDHLVIQGESTIELF